MSDLLKSFVGGFRETRGDDLWGGGGGPVKREGRGVYRQGQTILSSEGNEEFIREQAQQMSTSSRKSKVKEGAQKREVRMDRPKKGTAWDEGVRGSKLENLFLEWGVHTPPPWGIGHTV